MCTLPQHVEAAVIEAERLLADRTHFALEPERWERFVEPRGRPVPAIVLVRLAVDRHQQRAGVGRSLLQDTLLRCATAAEAIRARLLLVHVKDEAAKAWYWK